MKKIILIVCICVLLCQSAYAALIPEATAFRNYAKMLLRLCGLLLFFSLSIFDAEAQSFSWAKSMGGTGGDMGRSITVDASGNVYTTGYFEGTVDFDPGAGVFNLTAGVNNIFVSKLNASGSLVWVKSMGGTGSNAGLSIDVDASGNIYITGNFEGTTDFDPGVGVFNLTATTPYSLFVNKLDAAGNFIWVKQVECTDLSQSTSIAVDASGNVYTTGYFEGTADFDPGAGVFNLSSAGSSYGDIFVSKLDASGNFVWAKRIGGTGLDGGSSIAVDASGDIYITGIFQVTVDFDPGAGIFNLTSGGDNIFVSKLDASGNFVWAKQIGGTASGSGLSIDVDASGNVYTTGYFWGTADFDPGAGVFNLISAGNFDIFVSKLDASGNFVWAKSMGGSDYDEGQSIAVDALGNVYTTGHFEGTADFDPGAGAFNLTSAGILDIFVSKLDASGNFVWAISMGGTNDERAYSIALDASGNVYTTGYFTDTADFDPGAGVFELTSGGMPYVDIFVSKLSATVALAAPVATAATSVASTSFSANWGAVGGATSYRLDVSTSNLFGSFVAGYNGLNVGNVSTFSVAGLTAGTTYYYRVRAFNGTASASSNTITVITSTLHTIPDANFRAWLVTNYSSCMVGSTGNEQLDISCASINTITNIDVNGKNISDLTGIEYFTSLTTLNCSNNQLTSLPTLPSSLNNLNCSNNQLTNLPNLSISNIANGFLIIRNNKLEFDDIAPNVVKAGSDANYAPQSQINLLPAIQNVLVGNTINFTVTVGGVGNQYQWYKNNIAITGANSATYSKISISADAGIYRCDIINPSVPNLTLQTNDVTLIIDSSNLVSIPDANFRAYLVTNYPSCMVGSTGNEQLDINCASISTIINIDVTNKNIADLTGIEYFTSLTNLDCNQNQLTSLPTLPSNLVTLRCALNQLTSLPALPSSLTSLSCERNQIASLPTLPSSLTTLTCAFNQLPALPALPSSLTNLNCNFNQLTSLPVLPSSLTFLNCGSNQLTSLPVLPSSLTFLWCSNNQLTSLPVLPSSLTEFYCGDNQITNIPDLSTSNIINLGLVIRNNKLEFDDIAPNVVKAGVPASYAPQSRINLLPAIQNVLVGNIVNFTVTVGGVGNQYQWYKDNIAIAGATPSPTYSMITTSASAGIYRCDITNPAVPNLTLQTNDVTLIINSSNFVSIPDANFRAYLVANFPSCMVGSAGNEQLDINSASISTIFGMSPNNKNIGNLEGIQYFINLKALNCSQNQLVTLPALPTNLQDLWCYGNQLVTLPALPTNLELLDCAENQLVTLPALPTNLKDLYCHTNQLVTLPALPTNLQLLHCRGNQLVTLPPLPTNLKLLDCSKNQITNLPILPNSMTGIDCSFNSLNTLPALPVSLTHLYCNSNSLNTLPTLPAYLDQLYCSSNSLTTIPSLPNTLRTLSCSNNKISTLPLLPNSISYLACEYNLLTTLPNLPTSLTYLACQVNKLSSLPALPNSLGVLSCFNNQLTSLPTLTNSLREVFADNNKLTTLSALPNSLTKLTVSNNLLPALPALPNFLVGLTCADNLLTALPALPNTLSILYCNNNQISNLPNLSSTNISTGELKIQNNKFEFDDIIPNISKANIAINYAPQANITITPASQTIDAGNTLSIDVTVGGTGNQYQWFKGGAAIIGANLPTYSQSNVTLADAGVYYCEITNPSVADLTLKSTNVTISINALPPTLTSILPTSASINQEITLTGTNFSNVLTDNQISIGGKTVFAKSATGTEIKVDVPVGVFGEVEVQVTVLSKPSNKLTLPILPVVSDFSPAEGYLGDIVSIIGSGFSSVKANNEVSFGSVVVPAADVRSASINAISVKVPNGAKGVLPIKVKVGTQTGVSATNFTVKGTEIQDFAPQEAYIGDKINLLGAGFSSVIIDNQVFFGTVQATVISASNNLLVVEVPAGISGSLPISLQLFGDTYTASPNFKLKASEITEVSPNEGFVGETVSIIGNGFFSTVAAENVVLFGTTPATVSKASRSSLSVVVPAGISGNVPVSVTKGGEKVNAPQPFNAKTPRITEINPDTGYPNDVVVISGEGFSSTISQNKVFFDKTAAEITKASKSSLSVKVPKMKIGEVDVSVSSSDVAIANKLKFTVRGTGITDVIPLIGFTDDNITILGDGFSTTKENNKVFFGTFAAEVISASRTTMTVKVPKDAKGEVSVSLSLDKDKYEAPKLFKANVITVDAVLPTSGKIGDIITITGFGFDKNAKVLIGGKEAVITFSDPNKLNVKVPEGVFGEVEVLVEARGDKQKGTFLIRAIIDGFEPLSGFAEDKITFTGSGLNPDLSKNVILIGDKRVEIIRESFANNKFSVLIPKGVGGSVPVTVNGEVLPNNLVVLTKVSNISPKEGIEGTEVTIFGTGFSPELNNNTVSFNDVNVIPFEVKDDFLKVRVPSGISGEVAVTLRVRASRTVSVINDFGVIPQIKSIAPEKAPTNAEVSIIGTSFSEIRAENKVLFGDKQATVISARNTELKVRVPSGNGKVPVVVNVSKEKSNAKEFEISSEIKVVTPNGGEFLAYNSNFSITFTSSFDDEFKIELIGGKEVITIATLKNNERAFTWLVPSFVEKGENYKIKISSLGEIKTNDESDAVFSIGSEALDTKITTLYPPSIDYQSSTPIRVAIEVGKSLQGLEGALFYKPFSSKDYKKVGVASTENTYFVQIPFSEFDQAGLEYYFELYRGGRLQAKSANGRTVIKYPSLEIPYNSYGKNVENYEMISIPLKLQEPQVTDIFKDELGAYNIKQWRTFSYRNGSTNEFAGGTVNVGEAFWLIIKDKPSLPLMTGAGTTIETSTELSRMHTIKVRKGWNQIGNPYLFALDFENLKKANKNLGITSLFTFEKGGYVESKQLNPFRGGFVFIESIIGNEDNLKFPPAPFDPNSGGKTEENDFANSSLNSDTWQVKLNLLSSSTKPVRSQTPSGTADRFEKTNGFGGFGMHPKASKSKDEFDRLTPPRFLEHLEINFLHNEYFYPYFSKDIVPTQESYVWEFSVESGTDGNYKTLSWEKIAANQDKALIIFDIERNIRIDMSKENAYTFELGSGKKNFKIYFGDEKFLRETVLPENASAVAYPNPFTDNLKFSISVPEKSKAYLQIFNSIGQVVMSEERAFEAGFNVWDLSGTLSSAGTNVAVSSSVGGKQDAAIAAGVYLYQLQVETNGKVQRFSGKVVRE